MQKFRESGLRKGERHTQNKTAKPSRFTQPQKVIVDLLSRGGPVLPHRTGVVGRQQHKGEHAGDVEGEAGPQDSEPGVEGSLVQRIGPGHEAAARRLQDESDNVAQHEDDSVGARLKSRVGGAVYGDNARESEV